MFLYTLATDASETTVQVTLISTLGLIVVAIIGVITAKITTGARRESQVNAAHAEKSAEVARDYAAALEAKDTLIESLEHRLEYMERQNEISLKRIEELERRAEENDESRRAAALIERAQHNEISSLRAEIRSLKH